MLTLNILRAYSNKISNKLLGVVHMSAIGKKKGDVLISYVIDPFLSTSGTNYRAHSNQWECAEIVHLFLERGYAVDIIRWDNVSFRPKKDYAFVIDIHQNLERLNLLLPSSCIKIMHITAKHWLFQNNAEYGRLLELQKRKGATLIPRRVVPPARNIEHADYATIIGDELTKDTYAYAKKPFFSIPISTTTTFNTDPQTKNFTECKTRFVWIGGGGMVLKGLDLVLEYFSKHPEYHLTVCGNIKAESDFEELYFKELYETQNITTLGKINITSDAFGQILKESAALIFPSASESQSGSVITAMHGGLIPIISKEAGVPVGDFGITLETNTISAIEGAVEKIAQEAPEKLSGRAYRAWTDARSRYTRETFTVAYAYAIDTIMEKHNL